MKKIYTLILCILFFSLKNTYSQIDTSGGRYWDETLFPNVTKTSDVTYGSNINNSGQTQTLVMDIYEPTGDLLAMRPLIIFAHGGSFVGGSKTDNDVTSLCTGFAKMGYVTASIEYRYGMWPIDSVNAIKAVLRATQDMKAAIRYFRQDATGANTYRIHPDYIFTGGSSAGAFMALHAEYLDKVSEFPLGATVLNSMGGLDGTSGNPGYSSHSSAIVNLCGALGDSSYIESGNTPFVSMHGNLDGTVPYGTAIIQIFIFNIMKVDGSASLHDRAVNLGIQNPFYTFWGADHVPFAGTNATGIAYMDTTVQFVKEFLRPFLGIPVPTGIAQNVVQQEIKAFPNPSRGVFTIVVPNFNQRLSAQIVDLTGRLTGSFEISNEKTFYNNPDLTKGVYFLTIMDADKNSWIQKIVID